MKVQTIWGISFPPVFSGLPSAEDPRDTMRKRSRETENHVKDGDEENPEPDSGHADE